MKQLVAMAGVLWVVCSAVTGVMSEIRQREELALRREELSFRIASGILAAARNQPGRGI